MVDTIVSCWTQIGGSHNMFLRSVWYMSAVFTFTLVSAGVTISRLWRLWWHSFMSLCCFCLTWTKPERQQKLRMPIVYNGLPKFLGRLLYAYLHPLLGADELSGLSWQLITAVHDEGDSLSLCEWLSWGYDCTRFHVTFNCCCGEFSVASSSFLFDQNSQDSNYLQSSVVNISLQIS
jgi:hypothetical protein